MIKIIADDKIPFLKGALDSFAEVLYMPGKEIEKHAIKDTDALLIRTRTKCTDELLEGTRVRFIGTATIGFDHIDTQYCEKHKIHWTNAPGCNSSSVQQYVTAALLKISSEYRFSLKDKKIGIVGVGNVGTKVKKISELLGMKVLLNDPPRARKEGDTGFMKLGNLLHDSDIVTVHVPLNCVGEDMTYHLFNERNFQKMKKGTWFINCSRGEVTETSALKKVLESGKLSGAIADVWENEPDIDLELMEKSFIATPHIAGYSTDGKANGTAMIVNSLCRFFDLPLKDWYPSDVPPPSVPGIVIDCEGKTDQDIIREAVFHTYDISQDDINLRFSPADFEKQRGNYPLRREFPSFRVDLKGGKKSTRILIKKIGFRVV